MDKVYSFQPHHKIGYRTSIQLQREYNSEVESEGTQKSVKLTSVSLFGPCCLNEQQSTALNTPARNFTLSDNDLNVSVIFDDDEGLYQSSPSNTDKSLPSMCLNSISVFRIDESPKDKIVSPVKQSRFGNLLYGDQVDEKIFQKYLLQIQRGLLYAQNCLKAPSEEFVLSRKRSIKQARIPKKKWLFLDLDETLIHMVTQREPHHEEVYVETPEGEVKICFNVRPHCRQFLATMSRYYDVYIFTASLENYARAIVHKLDPQQIYIQEILSRDYCLETKNGFFIKDLRIIADRDLTDMLIVDNLSHSFGLQMHNGVPIMDYTNDPLDEELRFLCNYLVSAADKADCVADSPEILTLNTQLATPIIAPSQVQVLSDIDLELQNHVQVTNQQEVNITVKSEQLNGYHVQDDATGRYEGIWKDSQKDGEGHLLLQNGDSYRGNFINNKPNGYGIYITAEGNKYLGNFVNGKREGEGEEFYADGSHYVGRFKNDMKEIGIMSFPDGQKYSGKFYENQFNGPGEYHYSDYVFEGFWLANKRHGKGTCKWHDDKIFICTYENGLKQGEGQFVWPDGKRLTGTWNKGMLSGQIRLESNEVVTFGEWSNDGTIKWQS